jgi:mono/diheme cytochrome c family protein
MRALAPFLLLAIIACSDAPQGETDASDSKSGAPAPEKLYRSKNCITCHGQDLGGTMLAPSIRGLGVHWKPDDLAAFLKEPKAWLEKDARLAETARAYRSPMPPTFGTDAERLALAQWLLAQP